MVFDNVELSPSLEGTFDRHVADRTIKILWAVNCTIMPNKE